MKQVRTERQALASHGASRAAGAAKLTRLAMVHMYVGVCRRTKNPAPHWQENIREICETTRYQIDPL
jgi:hypothetical protein